MPISFFIVEGILRQILTMSMDQYGVVTLNSCILLRKDH